jgi:pimeloyl-ACP methyl ester carboxylesterase
MTRLAAVLAAATVALLTTLPAAADAALDFKPCPAPAGVECANMNVPIDRSGSVPGSLPLLIERVPASQPAAGKAPIVFLSGGPGQSNTDLTTLFAPIVKSFAPDRDVLSIALRGTGPSAIDCPGLTLSGADTGSAIQACAAKLGPARNFYTTRDTVDDIESVRAAIGIPKLVLYGTSYGTYEAYAYAVRHPDAVESLVLDSTVAPEFLGDVFQTRLIGQLPVVARADCADGRCKGITSDPWADLRKLDKRIRRKAITTHVYGPGGKRKAVTITELGTLLQMFAFDVDANLRAELPRALLAALHRDYVPLGRLLGQSRTQTGPPPDPRPGVNPGLYYAAACEEYDWPWNRSASPADKFAQAVKAVNAIPSSSLRPLGPQVAFDLSAASQCASWPERPDPPAIGSGPPPDVPVLLLHGRFDARTGLPLTQAVAARFPHSKILVIPDTGHSTIRHDTSGCAIRGTREFLAGQTVQDCTSTVDPFSPRRLVPHSLRAVKGVSGVAGDRGTAIRAAALTVQDVLRQIDVADGYRPTLAYKVRGGGLRGGTYRGTGNGPKLTRVVFVPGVRVSGSVPAGATAVLKLSGRVRGTLRFAGDGTVRGKLAGRTVKAKFVLPRASEFDAATQTFGPPLARRFWPEPSTGS